MDTQTPSLTREGLSQETNQCPGQEGWKDNPADEPNRTARTRVACSNSAYASLSYGRGEPWMDDRRRCEVKGAAVTVLTKLEPPRIPKSLPGNVEIHPAIHEGRRRCAIGALKGRAD